VMCDLETRKDLQKGLTYAASLQKVRTVDERGAVS
jgi:hypothetical protein